LTDCSSFERTLIELKIARAYGRLSCIPGHGQEASVSLASISSYEIRMFRDPKADLDGAPLFWLELIDHSIKTSVDSCGCFCVKDAVAIFDNFISQATCPDNRMKRATDRRPAPPYVNGRPASDAVRS
jgi:hypothetical protein